MPYQRFRFFAEMTGMFVFSIEYLIVEFQQEVYRFDPSRENVDLKNPQIFQIYEIKNNFSAIHGQSATTTTAASGGNREELLGQRPARRKCRPRHDADAGGRNPISGGHFKWLCSGNSKIKFHCFCFSLSFASRAARLMASTSTSSTAPMPHAEAKSPSSKARRYSSTESVAPLEV